MTKDSTFAEPQRILVILLPVLGDVLLGTPILRALRKRYPSARIDVLLRQGCEAMLEGNPDVSGILTVGQRQPLRDDLRLYRRLFRQYDLAISNSVSDRAAGYSWAAARQRIAWHEPDPLRKMGQWKRRAFQRWPDAPGKASHPLIHHAATAELLGLDFRYDLTLPSSPDSAKRVARILEPADQTKPTAILHPLASQRYKRWRAEGWSQLSSDLVARGFQIVVTGGGGTAELEYIREIFDGQPGVLVAAGKLRLADFQALFARANLYVGVDTCISHMAASTGLASVVLFGAERADIWGAWPAAVAAGDEPVWPEREPGRVKNVSILRDPLPCLPCRRSGCDNHRDSHSLCVENVTEKQILSALHELLPDHALA